MDVVVPLDELKRRAFFARRFHNPFAPPPSMKPSSWAPSSAARFRRKSLPAHSEHSAVGRLANTTHQLVRVLRDERDEVDDLLRDCDANIAAARGLYASLPASAPAPLPEPVVVAAPVAAAADGVDMDWQAIEASVQARGALGDCPICMMGMSGIAAERRGVELLSCSHCFQSASHWLRLPSGCTRRWPERSGPCRPTALAPLVHPLADKDAPSMAPRPTHPYTHAHARIGGPPPW